MAFYIFPIRGQAGYAELLPLFFGRQARPMQHHAAVQLRDDAASRLDEQEGEDAVDKSGERRGEHGRAE